MEVHNLSSGAAQACNLTSLVEDGQRTTYRGWREPGIAEPLLAVVLAAQQPERADLERLEHEYALADELDGAWALRPRALIRDGGRTVLLLEDPGGVPLESLLGAPMELGLFLRVAVGAAAALGRVHRRGLVHRDVKPASIVVKGEGEEVRLTGFGIASRLPSERRLPEPPESMAGTLAYMAPEQTGRMNRSIDSRSDLYSLGVTLYRALTGALPFSAHDPMEWVHCHIAMNPMPPAERVAAVPGAVSAIVMRLLAKAAEDRYQTAAGLEHDLRRCLGQWQARGRVDDAFVLGEQDTPDRLLIPEKLYGRAGEIQTLAEAFDRVASSGRPELVLISGYSGIGKSAVVHELHKALLPSHGLFAAGKFERYKRDIPYAPLANAFRGLIRTLLAKSEVELADWRHAIGQALGPNGALVCELVPELRHIVGDPPPVPPLAPQDAQANVHRVLQRFIGVFARPEHPLVLFLDDLQWLDAAALGFLVHLVTHAEVAHLLLIGAYRDNEVESSDPLPREIQAMRRSGATVHEITLEPLPQEQLDRLIADSLHCEAQKAASLAALVTEKTGGNPFFAVQFLNALVEDGLLHFDHDQARWSWDLAAVRACRYTGNVIELMVARLGRLPIETQSLLQQLACLGSHADTAALCAAFDITDEQAHAGLLPAAHLGLVARLDHSYAFAHDRVQEAAYALIPEPARAGIHLRLGRLLLAETAPQQRDDRIFDIVNQLNRGARLIDRHDERVRLAQLNLVAAKRARASGAHASALGFLAAGSELLGEDRWQHQATLAFELELDLAECAFITGDRSGAKQRLESLSPRAVGSTDRAAVACLRINLETALDGSAHGVRVGLEYLRSIGVEWARSPER